MEYIGEHLLPGKLGHFFILLGFVSSLLAAIAYFFATNNRNHPSYTSWCKIGRIGFMVHGFSVFSIIAIIFYIMYNQYYEYSYVFAHVSDDLPMRYILSAFWEGQEGSFLLWMFWNVVLGMVLIFTAKSWEAPTLSVMALIQFFIGSMLLGLYIYIGDEPMKIGINPFTLLRDTQEGPIFASANYIETVAPMANGLNVLLQNYWMTIHPPTLFLGFASTAVPFAFAIAGLWTGRHKEWLKPVLTWSLFSGFMLGTGILMGGAWAYEALSFGGYWAWDPVENMSLVPWLVLVAGIHTVAVAKATGQSIRSSYIFLMLSFLLILYSTFLTRSGILGDSSVHAFTELGLEWQLVFFILFFLFLSFGLFFIKMKSIPAPQKEEASSSKEFWMFIGSIVLLFSAILITFSTSIPVYNSIATYFNPDFIKIALPADPVAHYNKYQLWIAILIGLFSGIAQFLRFRESNFKAFFSKIKIQLLLAILGALVLTVIIYTQEWIYLRAWQYIVLTFALLFTIFSNLNYILTFLKGNLKLAGAALAHLGFGVMIIGSLASGLNKSYVSNNRFLGEGILEKPDKNVLLIKDNPTLMNGYRVTYLRDTIVSSYTKEYELQFEKLDKSGEVEQAFSLYPNVLFDKKTGKLAARNPDTKHYWLRDIFTQIYLPEVESDPEIAKAFQDSLEFKIYELAVSDTFRTKEHLTFLEAIDYHPTQNPNYEAKDGDLTIGLKVGVKSLKRDSVYYAYPMAVIRGNRIVRYHSQINPLAVKVKIGDDIFDRLLIPENELSYKEFVLKQGESITYNGYKMTFENFNNAPIHPSYVPKEEDIAVGANIKVDHPRLSESRTVEPVYLIRGNVPFNLKDEIKDWGIHTRFTEINPSKKTITINVAQTPVRQQKVIVELAENSLRSDFVILESIIFPGINFFWLGSCTMLLGMLVSMAHRLK